MTEMTSKEVFAKRRAGKIDEAYQMALRLMEAQSPGEWDIKAFGWCLIDLIKRDSKLQQQQSLELYRQQLESLIVNPEDNILTKQREYALKLCNPSGKAMQQAKAFSQSGQHFDAVRIYCQLFNDGDHSDEVQISFGWGLYRLAKQVVEQDPPNFGLAHQCFGDYFRLTVKKDPRLHSCILRVADKMAKADKLNMGEFASIWRLENLTAEDFEPYISKDGKRYSSLAERVVQKAIKDACSRDALDDLNYIYPYLNTCIERFPDNIWLKYYKAKTLVSLGRSDEALPFGLEVVKNKANDFWSWSLLGDIHQGISTDLRLACYCKSLLCSKDINFVINVKQSLSSILIERENYKKAKLEIDEIVNYRRSNDYRIPPDVETMMAQDWYSNTIPASTNRDFYLEHAKVAEELLYSELPWINAVFGDSFTFKMKPGKPMRRLYLEASGIPNETVITESKVKRFKPRPGTGIKIKGEFDDKNRFQIYVIQERTEAPPWDIFNEQVGVVDHINVQKELLHFIIDRKHDGIVHFADMKDKFREGDAILVRFSNFTRDQAKQQRIVSVQKTNEPVPESLFKVFEEHVSLRSGMGFTDSGVFIPPPMVDEHRIADGCRVSGTAIINYNKKRYEWGWKAIRITNVEYFDRGKE